MGGVSGFKKSRDVGALASILLRLASRAARADSMVCSCRWCAASSGWARKHSWSNEPHRGSNQPLDLSVFSDPDLLARAAPAHQ